MNPPDMMQGKADPSAQPMPAPIGLPQSENAAVGQEYISKMQPMIDQMDGAVAQAQSIDAQGVNEAESKRIEALREVLLALKDQGVDLNDPESVAKYRQGLADRDPDLLTMFDDMMETLLTPIQPMGAEAADVTQEDPSLTEGVPESAPGSMPEGSPQMNMQPQNAPPQISPNPQDQAQAAQLA